MPIEILKEYLPLLSELLTDIYVFEEVYECYQFIRMIDNNSAPLYDSYVLNALIKKFKDTHNTIISITTAIQLEKFNYNDKQKNITVECLPSILRIGLFKAKIGSHIQNHLKGMIDEAFKTIDKNKFKALKLCPEVSKVQASLYVPSNSMSKGERTYVITTDALCSEIIFILMSEKECTLERISEQTEEPPSLIGKYLSSLSAIGLIKKSLCPGEKKNYMMNRDFYNDSENITVACHKMEDIKIDVLRSAYQRINSAKLISLISQAEFYINDLMETSDSRLLKCCERVIEENKEILSFNAQTLYSAISENHRENKRAFDEGRWEL